MSHTHSLMSGCVVHVWHSDITSEATLIAVASFTSHLYLNRIFFSKHGEASNDTDIALYLFPSFSKAH